MSLSDTMLRKLKLSLKSHGHHFIFGISIISLTALLAWWSVFIHNSISQQRLYRYDRLASDMKYYSLKLGLDGERIPAQGILAEDERFEVVFCQNTGDDFSRRLEPQWTEFCIRPRPELIQQIESESSRLNVMLVGEAAVFLLIIFVCSVFLYQYIRLERRTAQEIRQFWERSAHEIKTPITGIKAFLQNLKAGSFDCQELGTYVDLALQQVKKQEKLAENILSGYRLKSKAAHLALEKIGLVEFIMNHFTEDSLSLAGLKVKFGFERDIKVVVRANSQALRVILDNIMDNTIKYASPEPVLSIEVFKERKKAVVTFQDNGPGIPPWQAENIFQAYKHADEELPTQRQGTGMGLYISRQLVRSMGGDMYASSPEESGGAKLWVRLNLA